jgi:hypothetical protein
MKYNLFKKYIIKTGVRLIIYTKFAQKMCKTWTMRLKEKAILQER